MSDKGGGHTMRQGDSMSKHSQATAPPVHFRIVTVPTGPHSHQHDTRRALTGSHQHPCATSISLMHNHPNFMDLSSPAQCLHECSLHPQTCVIHHVYHCMHIQHGTIPAHCARHQACTTLFVLVLAMSPAHRDHIHHRRQWTPKYGFQSGTSCPP